MPFPLVNDVSWCIPDFSKASSKAVDVNSGPPSDRKTFTLLPVCVSDQDIILAQFSSCVEASGLWYQRPNTPLAGMISCASLAWDFGHFGLNAAFAFACWIGQVVRCPQAQDAAPVDCGHGHGGCVGMYSAVGRQLKCIYLVGCIEPCLGYGYSFVLDEALIIFEVCLACLQPRAPPPSPRLSLSSF
ncbi:hypothetical protein Ae201684_013927 [Aphanomyces euteiches]|uniref:Uncharacterized protein n=1 Tax=Aphanomyces euteiches TaxID=100861 RepID=A0A6G0WLE0_9STRA|nr:hypothetical protein Ae201684_013927 [Aphanomyces euteiches]